MGEEKQGRTKMRDLRAALGSRWRMPKIAENNVIRNKKGWDYHVCVSE